MKRIVVIAGTAALAGGVGFGAAAAYADPSPRPRPATTSTNRPPAIGAPGMPGMPGVPGRVFPGGPPGLDQMLHGEAVAKDEGGAIKTHDWQNGQVTAVSGSSVTVRGADGVTWTWTLNGDTKVRKGDKDGSASDIAAGDKVVIAGLRTGGTRTASMVADPPPDFAKARQRLRDLRKDLPDLPRLRDDLKREPPSPPA